MTIAGLSSMATRHILADLARDYEQRRGVAVDIRSMGGVEAAKLSRAGEPTDIVILASKVMKALEAEGHIVKGSIRDFARSEIGIAVRAGAPHPGIESDAAVNQAMIDANRICYSTGPSGDHLKALCEKWGLSDTVLARALVAPPGVPVAESRRQGRGRSRLSAAQRTHRAARNRRRRPLAARDTVGHGVLVRVV